MALHHFSISNKFTRKQGVCYCKKNIRTLAYFLVEERKVIEEIETEKSKAKENPSGQRTEKTVCSIQKDSKKSRSQRTYMPLRIEFDTQSVKELSFNWRKKRRWYISSIPAYKTHTYYIELWNLGWWWWCWCLCIHLHVVYKLAFLYES